MGAPPCRVPAERRPTSGTRDTRAANARPKRLHPLPAANGKSASSRFHPTGQVPYVRTDGIEIVAVDSDLFAPGAVLEAPVDVDATGGVFGVGTTALGSSSFTDPPTDNCVDWTTSSASSFKDVWSGDEIGTKGTYRRDCSERDAIVCLQD